jgi:pilus assembly protein FimV
MQKTRKRIIVVWLAGLGLLGIGPVAAIGFLPVQPTATLGRPLDISVPLRLEPGEDLAAECVAAEVTVGETLLPPAAVGETLLPPAAVGATLEVAPGGRRAIRVRTWQNIDEPVLTVQVAAGCGQRLTRRYVVLADPPTMAAPPLVAEAPAADPGAVATPPARSAAPAPRRPRRSSLQGPEAPAPARSTATRRPRLRLDAAPPPTAQAVEPPPASAVMRDEAMVAVEAANEAVKAAIASASTSQSRIAALESDMRRLADESAAQRRQMDLLRGRAEAAESRSRWTGLLAAAWLLLAAGAWWMWRRLRALERERREGWRVAASEQQARVPEPAAPLPAPVPVPADRAVRRTGLGTLGAGLAPAHAPTPSSALSEPPSTVVEGWRSLPETMAMRTQPLVPQAPPEVQPPVPAVGLRDVSAEELIDLEQQAEFFIVLGQEEAAVDLLVAHLRDTGGTSPLPYLKLLDIYRRRGDRAAYERTRDRFNHRFNAHVPGWESPSADGYSLQDYPETMRRLQAAWPKPLDAMAELEAMLFRRDAGELFELPAYRELLLLYAMARDLLDADPGSAASPVDVLLPLSEVATLSSDVATFTETTPRPYFGDDRSADPEPTAPIDLELDLQDDTGGIAEDENDDAYRRASR